MTDNRQGAAVAAATDTLLALLLVAAPAADAEDDATTTVVVGDDDAILGAEEDGWAIEDFRFAFRYLDQRGRGYQSKAEAGEQGPGREDIVVIQPMLYTLIRQSKSVRHQVYLPVDVVSSASTNALDAVSSASAVTEAADLDVTTIVDLGEDSGFNVRYGVHWEEPMTSLFFGGGLGFEMAQDNATLGVNVLGIVDMFDTLMPDGHDTGLGVKWTGSANVTFSQLLSPTTVGWLSYGVTYQRGTLETTYNSVPIEGTTERLNELFPKTRLRHAASARIAQHIPPTRTTIRGGYRFYIDDIDIDAHTADVQVYQYLGPHVLLSGSYRFHTQDAAAFWRTSVPEDFDETAPRTADSDLAAFDSHEIGARVMYLFNPRGSAVISNEQFNLSYSRYFRPNLRIDSVAMTYAGRF